MYLNDCSKHSQNLFSNTIVIKASMHPTSKMISILANWGRGGVKVNGKCLYVIFK